ncbi:MAG: putative RNA uridine N3 methyltransferase [Candidatus Nitrosocaldus sp.]
MLSVAIPDSSLAEESTLREKSIKAAMMARTMAIFGVETVLIYRDVTGDYRRDGALLRLILEFMDTPQYMRKRLYGRMKELRYAGLLPPLKAPHHKPYIRLDEVKVGDVREGVVVKGKYVDVGLDKPVALEYADKAREGRRVSVIFTSPYPDLRCRIVSKDEIKGYWGYSVRYAGTLGDLLRSICKRKGESLTIVTSKLGRPVREIEHDIADAKDILLIFGSPYRDVYEIAGNIDRDIDIGVDVDTVGYNFFPGQKVASVRLEEAILGCLAVVNYIRSR